MRCPLRRDRRADCHSQFTNWLRNDSMGTASVRSRNGSCLEGDEREINPLLLF